MSFPASAPTIAGPLMFGSRGNGVRTVQALLNKATIPTPGLTEDGNFGLRTDAAVRAFQPRKGLKPDGIVGRLTAQALGLQFVHQSPPGPKSEPPGTPQQGATIAPQTFLIGVLAKELKQISNRVEQTFNNGFDERPEVYDRARKHLRAITFQTISLLSPASVSGAGADFATNQTASALLMMVGGLGAVAGQIARGGGDVADITGIQSELNTRTGRVIDTVRKTLEGKIDGGIRAGVALLRSLLSDLTS